MNWLNDVSLDQFSAEARAAYDAYKAQYRKAKEARDVFEALVRSEIADAHSVDADCIAFNYRFGKLSLGFGEARKAKAPAAKAKSLTDWLASQG